MHTGAIIGLQIVIFKSLIYLLLANPIQNSTIPLMDAKAFDSFAGFAATTLGAETFAGRNCREKKNREIEGINFCE